MSYFPTTMCFRPAEKLSLSGAVATSNVQPFDPSVAPQYGIDGDIENTKWSPLAPHVNTYLEINLGGAQTLSLLALYFWATDWAESFHVDVSTTGQFSGEQRRIITESNGIGDADAYAEGSPIRQKNYAFESTSVQYIRLTIDAFRNANPSEAGQVNLYELELYQSAVPKVCLDSVTTGDVGIRSSPSDEDPLAEIRARVASHTSDLMTQIEAGSTFRGYKTTSAVPSVRHVIFAEKEFQQPIPASPTYADRPDYMRILLENDICDLVDNQGLKEVWIWSYYAANVVPDESNQSMGMISQAHWNHETYGDVSNSAQTPDLPVCQKTYTLFNFVYGPAYGPALHSYLHQLENIWGRANQVMFWDAFVGGQYAFKGPRRNGHTHTPPNSDLDYGYTDLTERSSDAENWQPIDCTSLSETDECGVRSSFNCMKWNCNDADYYRWWMQNAPGRDNDIRVDDRRLRNWWDFVVDYDAALAAGADLVSSAEDVPATVLLTVEGGTGSGEYSPGAVVPISATPVAANFDRWAGTDAVYVNEVTAADALIIVPARSIRVTAIHSP